MKRASGDVINGWQAGKTYPGVIFVQAEDADVVAGAVRTAMTGRPGRDVRPYGNGAAAEKVLDLLLHA